MGLIGSSLMDEIVFPTASQRAGKGIIGGHPSYYRSFDKSVLPPNHCTSPPNSCLSPAPIAQSEPAQLSVVRHQDDISQSTRHSLPNGVEAHETAPLPTKSYGKHGLDDDTDSAPEVSPKKTRVETERAIDGDKEAGWHGSNEDMDIDDAQPVQRGAKRMASSEDDEGFASAQSTRRDKRARKVSLDKSTNDDMDEDELDDMPEGVVRGKKRDRAEAGSSFGGDDSVQDDDEEKSHRHRRKRAASSKIGPGLTRGQKRSRALDSNDSDESEGERTTRKAGRKKRGKRAQHDMSPVSSDPLCKGRRIGEEWESNGIHYKVGPNGQRLRQALVKKAKSKFHMVSIMSISRI